MSEAHLTSELFASSLEVLYSKLNQCDSKTWHIHQFEESNFSSIEMYTTQTVLLNSSFNTDSTTNCAAVFEEDYKLNHETSCNDSLKPHALIEYRIGYSESFEVPVLYLRGKTVSGSCLSLQDMWQVFERQTGAKSSHIFWEALTQVEHPYLHIPYFQIHPCKTGQVMVSVNVSEKDKYLLLWLSVFGAMVSLDLPITIAL